MALVDSSYSALGKRLGASDDVQQTVTSMLAELTTNYKDEYTGDPKVWYCALLYTVTVDKRYPYGMLDLHAENGDLSYPTPTVMDLLKEADVNMATFFQKLRVIKESCKLSEAVLQNIIDLERNYCIVSAIYFKYEKLFDNIFRPEEKNPGKLLVTKRLCWSIFVLARSSGCYSQELVTVFSLLLCCLESVMQEFQSFQLLEPFDTTLRESREADDNTMLLKQLCETFSASYEETYDLCESHWKEFAADIPKDENGFDITKIYQMCVSFYERDGDFDSLLFLTHDPYLVPDPRTSPLRANVPYTPVTSALTTVQALKAILADAADSPNEVLQVFFKSCASDPSETIQNRARELEDAFVCHFCRELGATEASIARIRMKMALRLYYRVMEALLRSEEERLHTKDFSQLLSTDSFHKSLLACSVEVVMVTYGLSWKPTLASPGCQTHSLAFPWVLEAFKLRAYSFYKVLDSFIKAEPQLPSDIIDHLHGIENQILESLAWKEDSPLFDVMRASCPEQTSSSSVPVTLASPAAASTSAQTSPALLYASPIPSRASTSHTSSAPAALASPPNKISKSVSLNHFFNTVCRLAFQRLKFLCSHLEIPRECLLKIWLCLEHCITHEPNLMKNRHVDQMIMCSIYGLCKVATEEVKFKTIVNAYRALPHSSHSVYKNVLIKGEVTDSIIIFYNRVFIPAMKAFIQRFNPQKAAGSSPMSPTAVLSLKATTASSPVTSIATRNNIHLSPMSESPFKIPLTPSRMTPRTRRLYSFGENLGQSEILKSINESMNRYQALKRQPTASKGAPPKSRKRIKFDTPADEEGEETASGTAETNTPAPINPATKETAECATERAQANIENNQ
ncbi:retinoblastoma-associated protein-like [Lineus longissimus]|uniref:retinoblastoma-associated protein-like n=1 Tax=Lineus longissimus TaxID=88925 RepID=UPI002B4F2256